MSQFGKDRKQVCDDLGFKYTTFTDWYNGNKYPRIDKIEILADYFGVLKSDLIEEKTVPSNAIPYTASHKAPIVGSIPAGYPVLAFENIEGYADIPYSDEGEYFFLRVSGESMKNAGIHTGDLVLIRRQKCADDGQVVAARVNGDEATLKRYKRQGDSVLLLPENPDFEPRIVPVSDFETGDAEIIGVALEVRHTL
jgi:repressor LexA